jgi:hypothetical protein
MADSQSKAIWFYIDRSRTWFNSVYNFGNTNGETVGTVTIAFVAVLPSNLSGAAPTDPVGVYTGSIMPSGATGGTFTSSDYNIAYVPGNITVTRHL